MLYFPFFLFKDYSNYLAKCSGTSLGSQLKLIIPQYSKKECILIIEHTSPARFYLQEVADK